MAQQFNMLSIIIQWKFKSAVSFAGFAVCHRLAHSSLIIYSSSEIRKRGEKRTKKLNFYLCYTVHW